MNITEKQKQQLIDLNDSRVNKILNIKLNLNKWYKDIDSKFMIYLTKYTDLNNCEGFYFDGTYGEYQGFDDNLGFHSCILATKQEIEQALTNEAKRQGFGTSGNKFHFCKEDNRLLIDGVEIFNNGQWAKITDEKSELKEEIKELRNKLKSLEEKL